MTKDNNEEPEAPKAFIAYDEPMRARDLLHDVVAQYIEHEELLEQALDQMVVRLVGHGLIAPTGGRS